jgi:hypothetical protein
MIRLTNRISATFERRVLPGVEPAVRDATGVVDAVVDGVSTCVDP